VIRKILVADDESHIRDVVRFAVENAGFVCIEASDGQEALQLFAEDGADLVILDVKMPHVLGTDVCREIRRTSDVPIIFLSSNDTEIDLVVGLELGADDYVTKPFSPRELVSRIRAVLRRYRPIRAEPADTTSAISSDNSTLVVGQLRINVERHEATWAGEPVAMTATEFGVLLVLAARPGRVFTRDELMDRMYRQGRHIESRIVSDRTVDSHIRSVRKSFACCGVDPIETVRGVGYRLADCQ